MPDDVFVFSGAEEKKEETVEEKIERLEATIQMMKIEAAECRMYLSEWAHDMRTPLHSLLGYADVAEENMNDQVNLKECLHQISLSGKELSELVSEMLRRSKKGDFSVKNEKDKKCWDSMLQRMGDLMRPQLLGKHLTLKIDLREVSHMEIDVDCFRLQQILWNLTENAIKYSKESGAILVSVSEKESEEEGYGLFTIRIQDTGIGINKEFLPHVYDRHVREDRDEVAAVDGQGLGLTAVKRTVEWFKGTIEVESILDYGTTFTVTLPIRIVEKK